MHYTLKEGDKDKAEGSNGAGALQQNCSSPARLLSPVRSTRNWRKSHYPTDPAAKREQRSDQAVHQQPGWPRGSG